MDVELRGGCGGQGGGLGVFAGNNGEGGENWREKLSEAGRKVEVCERDDV